MDLVITRTIASAHVAAVAAAEVVHRRVAALPGKLPRRTGDVVLLQYHAS